ncbi:lipoprotein signal peptidase [Dysgonomonas massiliensis]|uniref:lipoprotein signal peptidase n=1 Tax=Dysgonomonas massiliensis TaxID=2040292 RepID=UPI000C75AD98|nr:lipoprotein signal peptidase [Dysgonomonas massiliensis]
MKNLSRGTIAIIVVTLVILIDQISKIWVKTSMMLGDSIEIASWFKIYFIENPGMAFGLELGGKLFLTLFRIVAVGFIGYYLVQLIKKKYAKGFIACIALILAGAFGNIIDCIFYGEIFSSSYGQVATFVPLGEGYADWMHGKVVDMLYFPLIESNFPSWMPFVGGEHFIFFSPVFNIADSAITIGIFILVLFYHKTLSQSFEKEENK